MAQAEAAAAAAAAAEYGVSYDPSIGQVCTVTKRSGHRA